jgi:hypothetical protein
MDAKPFVALLLVLAGCASSHKCAHCHAKSPVAVVSSSGTFCVARRIEIPPDGIALGEIVEVVLRPGLLQTGLAIGGQPLPASREPLPELGSVPVVVELIDQWIDNFITSASAEETARDASQDLVNSVRSIHPELVPSEIAPASLTKELTACFDRYQAKPVPIAGAPDIRRQVLGEELLASAICGDLWSPLAPTDEQLVVASARAAALGQLRGEELAENVVLTNLRKAVVAGAFLKSDDHSHIERTVALLPTLTTVLRNDPLPSALAPEEQPVTSQPVGQIAVVVNKKGGRSIVIPLWLVRGYLAGDIRLVDGDHVQIEPYSRVNGSLGQVGQSDGHVLIVGLEHEPTIRTVSGTTSLGLEAFLRHSNESVADVAILRRINELGRLQEYIIPMPQNEFYTDQSAVASYVAQTTLKSGDQLHFEVLDLTPLLTASRNRGILGPELAKCSLCSHPLSAQCTEMLQNGTLQQCHQTLHEQFSQFAQLTGLEQP